MICSILVERVFVADGLGIRVLSDIRIEPATRILAVSLSRQRQSPLAKMLFQRGLIERSQVTDFAYAQRVEVLLHHLSDARNAAYIQRREKFCFLLGNNPEHSIRFRLR